ncbi:MAG: peptide-methionine (S)-S-oxide reductase MsrA [Magnetococcales bacterium]|nr:peptide-methionine (S)-S-oxide reductase MsrA [Magnetococcales bacterium]
MFGKKSLIVPTAEQALPGREEIMPVPEKHFVLDGRLKAPFPDTMEIALFGLGCFWGAERKFWTAEGVYSTMVGYSAGATRNPTYHEVCSGMTGHNEVVQVVFDPQKTAYEALLKLFWESHNPTQGMRQGNDVGTQYRSGIYCFNDDQMNQAKQTCKRFQAVLTDANMGAITTEIIPAGPFYYAEEYHQQYLAKNPGGYCGLGGTGVLYPVG